MPRTCSVCRRDDREAIDEALVRQVPMREIAKRHEPVTIASLSRHSAAHVSPALQSVQVERAKVGPRSALDRLEELYGDARSILDSAKVDGKANLSLQAVRELRAIVESLAKITGELDERPTLTVNLMTSPQWLMARAAIFSALQEYPAARVALAGRLASIESGRERA